MLNNIHVIPFEFSSGTDQYHSTPAPSANYTTKGFCQKLNTLCETRWTSRSEALYTFLTSYYVVVDSLEDLERKGDAKARSFVCSIKKFDFIITLVAVQSVLQPLVPLSDMLQQKGVDLIEAFSESRIIIEQLNRKRNNDE